MQASNQRLLKEPLCTLHLQLGNPVISFSFGSGVILPRIRSLESQLTVNYGLWPQWVLWQGIGTDFNMQFPSGKPFSIAVLPDNLTTFVPSKTVHMPVTDEGELGI